VAGNFAGSAANTPGTANNVVLTCTEVTVDAFPTCTVNGANPGTVTTQKLDGRAVFIGPKANDHYGITFTPESGTLFASVAIGGASCPLAGVKVEVCGTIVGTIETPNTDKVEQALNFPTPAITKVFNGTTGVEETDGLSIFGEPAQFTSTFDVKLTGANAGRKFGNETG
jgi:hypothetical protein